MHLGTIDLPGAALCARKGLRVQACRSPGLAAWLLCLPLLGASASDAQVPVTISLIGINDFHGHLLPPPGSLLVPDAAKPQGTRVAAGGAAYLASLVGQLQALNPGRTLLVGAGDLVGAAPLASGLFHDEPTIEVLNQMGLAVSSVGNHEFDKGRNELLRLQNGGCFPPSDDGQTGVVGKDTCMQNGAFGGAQFQYLAANVVDKRTGQTLFPATALREVGGVKIGFIGVTLRSTPSMVNPAGVLGLQFEREVDTVNRLAPLLKAQGAAAVVVLAHQGGQTSEGSVPDPACPDLRGPIVDMVDAFDTAVDVVLSGHTHQAYVCTRPDGKLLTQAGSYGRMLTHINLLVDAAAHQVLRKEAINHVVLNGAPRVDARGQPLPMPHGAKALVPDAEVEKTVRRYADRVAPVSDVVVGRLAAPLDRRPNAAGESTLGALVADAYLAATADASHGVRPAQIAFTNPGGLRADLGSLALTYGQLYGVLPFNNTLVSMDLTGQQILRLLEQQWERPQPPGGRVLAVSHGFSYTWDASRPAGATRGTGQRVVPGSMRLQGAVMDLYKLYRVTVNSYMVAGGDSFNVFKQGKNLYAGEADLVALTHYLGLQPVLAVPALGLIQRLN